MADESKIKYGSDTSLAVTAWSTGLAAGEYATSAIFDNTSSLFQDVMIGGGDRAQCFNASCR